MRVQESMRIRSAGGSFAPAHPRTLQRKCACGGLAKAGSECEECKQKKLQRKATDVSGSTPASPIVHDVLRSPGQPLDTGTRAFFEPRFGHDFSKVRVHTDEKAAESACSVNALAYTVGNDLVFGAGQFAPGTKSGQRLLAHELTHVVQQSQGSTPGVRQELGIGAATDPLEQQADRLAERITGDTPTAMGWPVPPPSRSQNTVVQRACGPAAIDTPTDCIGISGDLSGEHFLFQGNCDEFRPGEEARLRALANTLTADGSATIHGFASEEGDPTLNKNLSCARSIKGREIIESVVKPKGVRLTYRLFSHGAMPGNRAERRSITVDWLPAPPVATPASSPGTNTEQGECSKKYGQLMIEARNWEGEGLNFAADLLHLFLKKDHPSDVGGKFQEYAPEIGGSAGFLDVLNAQLASLSHQLDPGTYELKDRHLAFDVEYYLYPLDIDLRYALGGAHFEITSGKLTVVSGWDILGTHKVENLGWTQRDYYNFPHGFWRDLFSDYKAAEYLQENCGHKPFWHSETGTVSALYIRRLQR